MPELISRSKFSSVTVCLLVFASSSCSTNSNGDRSGSDSDREATNTSPVELDFYTVDHYDVARNPTDDLAMTVRRAQAEKKHILVQVGGDWCGWCKLMSHFIETNDRVQDNIRTNYLVMKVTY